MAYRHRIYFTYNQKAEIWDRCYRGESMSLIGRLFDRGASSIYPLLAQDGGMVHGELRAFQAFVSVPIWVSLRSRQSFFAL